MIYVITLIRGGGGGTFYIEGELQFIYFSILAFIRSENKITRSTK